ncbi:AB-hydrolase YheT [Lentithecium fluviatile CBS 122367]|uniref:alcohol O-acetyltransferase n=1 Tax=Lentithecium fluviatile CBS 122367 TaxID=1168545 RepID=A0A6G1JFG2_9PLEO|nr:AB-hydrolase YheT [Lentithecium fluviatile CBS 122367]
MFLFGHAKTTYTHHKSPIHLPTKTKGKTSLATIAQKSIPPCHLNPLLFNGHLQTFWTIVHAHGPPIHYKRKIIESTHSIYPGQFTVDFVIAPPSSTDQERAAEEDDTLPPRTTYYSPAEWENIGSDDGTPMLVCLHGLSGGSHEVYLREVVAPMVDAGWAACVVNGRGCAQSKITTPRLFNARSTWDVRQTVKYLGEMFPNRPLYAVGFSMGANIMTNYIGEEGSKCVFKAAVACSNPWDLNICHIGLTKTWLGLEVYSKTMGGNMRKLFLRHKKELLKNEVLDGEAIEKCRYLYEFDRVVQAPTWGYPTQGAYYRDAASVDAVLAIKIPFLAINAEDDPISQDSAIPYEEFKQNPYTVLCTTNWGGHLSWFQLGGKRWFATAISAFLTKMHDEVDLTDSEEEEVQEEANGKMPKKKYPIYDPCNRKLICPPE